MVGRLDDRVGPQRGTDEDVRVVADTAGERIVAFVPLQGIVGRAPFERVVVSFTDERDGAQREQRGVDGVGRVSANQRRPLDIFERVQPLAGEQVVRQRLVGVHLLQHVIGPVAAIQRVVRRRWSVRTAGEDIVCLLAEETVAPALAVEPVSPAADAHHQRIGDQVVAVDEIVSAAGLDHIITVGQVDELVVAEVIRLDVAGGGGRYKGQAAPSKRAGAADSVGFANPKRKHTPIGRCRGGEVEDLQHSLSLIDTQGLIVDGVQFPRHGVKRNLLNLPVVRSLSEECRHGPGRRIHHDNVIVNITAGSITAVQNIGRRMRAVERDRHRGGRGWVKLQPHNLQRRTRTEGCAADECFDERSSVASEFDQLVATSRIGREKVVGAIEGQPAPKLVCGVAGEQADGERRLPGRAIDRHEITFASHAVQDVGGTVVSETSNLTQGRVARISRQADDHDRVGHDINGGEFVRVRHCVEQRISGHDHRVAAAVRRALSPTRLQHFLHEIRSSREVVELVQAAFRLRVNAAILIEVDVRSGRAVRDLAQSVDELNRPAVQSWFVRVVDAIGVQVLKFLAMNLAADVIIEDGAHGLIKDGGPARERVGDADGNDKGLVGFTLDIAEHDDAEAHGSCARSEDQTPTRGPVVAAGGGGAVVRDIVHRQRSRRGR